MPIQRDRNWKLLQRISLDARQGAVADSQPAESDPPDDLRTRQVFADVWSISDTAPVDARAQSQAEAEAQAQAEAEAEFPAPPPAVERLRRMLESDERPDAVGSDQPAD
jgi:hypothetical protein